MGYPSYVWGEGLVVANIFGPYDARLMRRNSDAEVVGQCSVAAACRVGGREGKYVCLSPGGPIVPGPVRPFGSRSVSTRVYLLPAAPTTLGRLFNPMKLCWSLQTIQPLKLSFSPSSMIGVSLEPPPPPAPHKAKKSVCTLKALSPEPRRGQSSIKKHKLAPVRKKTHTHTEPGTRLYASKYTPQEQK